MDKIEVKKCFSCPMKMLGGFCRATNEPGESIEPRKIKDILAKPPKWCPLKKEDIVITLKKQ